MLNYLSLRAKSIKGEIRRNADDFAVEEIMPDGTVLELDKPIERPDSGTGFAHFVLQKNDWSTPDAAREIAKRLKISGKRINYAGTKDKRAVTTQLMSAFGVKKEEILDLKIKDMKILGAWESDKKIDLGALLGNRFRIRVFGGIDEKTINEIYSELDGKFPNYFGPQRFGANRGNTHKIGEMIARSDLRGAVEAFLTDCEGEENAEAIAARKQLKEEGDYGKALQYFPKHLKFERMVLQHLAEHQYDFANALRKLPRQILLLFVHAFQSHLFNIMLSERIAGGNLELEEGEYFCGEKYGFPDLETKLETGSQMSKGLCEESFDLSKDENRKLETGMGWLVGKIIGYETGLNEREKEILERFEIRKEDFRIRPLPEINSKGTFRTLLAPMKDFQYRDGVFAFSLPSGSYATSALREFIKDLW